MAKRLDLTGERFGRLKIESYAFSKNGKTYWNCRCDCGNKRAVRGTSLTANITTSCGCGHIKHGHYINGKASPERTTWNDMKQRCKNKNNKNYSDYGGRGIRICEQWEKFENFLSDMGEKPSPGHTIERLDVNGDYEPSNCVWVDRIRQARNRRLRINNSSGTEGVYKTKWGKYQAYITTNYKTKHLGMFDTAEEATKARKEAELKYWGKSS